MNSNLSVFNTCRRYILCVCDWFCGGLLCWSKRMVICCVELVAIVFKFCTCELLGMDNGVDYDM